MALLSKSWQCWHQYLHSCQGLFTTSDNQWIWTSQGPWKSLNTPFASFSPGHCCVPTTCFSRERGRAKSPFAVLASLLSPRRPWQSFALPDLSLLLPYLTKISSLALPPCCYSLDFQANAFAFQERSEVAVCHITSRHSGIYNGRRTSLCQPIFTAATVRWHR